MKSLLLLAFALTASSQEILVDWNAKTADPVCPVRIDRVGNVSLEVRNINDVLYTYAVHTRLIPRAIDDFGKLKESGGTAKDAGCNAAVQAANNLLVAFGTNAAFNPVGSGGSIRSIPLAETIAAWNELRQSENARAVLSAPAACRAEVDVQNALALIKRMDEAVGRSHAERLTIEIRPDHDVKVLVIESYQRSETATAEYSCSPASGVLSFSAGLLMTTLASRSYERRLVPGATAGSAGVEQLVVANNSGVQPAGAAFLNYRMWDSKNGLFGLSLSSGPVFKFTGAQGTSNFGFFGGLSLRFHDRFLITPGVHVGEFADFPAGFREGTPFPANFGQLSTVNRWTARFGLAITYATPDFGKARKDIANAKVVIGGLSATPPPPPAPAPAKTTGNTPADGVGGVGSSNPGAGAVTPAPQPGAAKPGPN